jgi:hypothetical protein
VTLIRSRSSYTYTYTDTQLCMFVCLFVFLSIPDSLLPNSDSLSLLIQSYMPTCILVCVCMYIFVLFLFVFLSVPYSWLPDSLFLLDTGSFVWRTTSCRTCHRTFLPDFHRFSEFACFSWLSTAILGRQTDTVERLAKWYQHTRARAHIDHSKILELRW